MYTRRIVFFVFSFLFFCVFYPTADASTIISGTINDPLTVWDTAGSPYVIQGTVTVSPIALLRIEPGTKIQFDSGAKINVWGTLSAAGTAASPITVTSIKDNGVDIPMPGDYGGFYSGLGSWNYYLHMNFKYATMPINIDYEATVTNTGNTFLNNKINGIGLSGYSGNRDLHLKKDGAPYVLIDNLFTSPSNTFTLDPGVILKPLNDFIGIIVYGTLISNGTTALPIVFTSLDDDSFGGDTNGDGASSVDPDMSPCFSDINIDSSFSTPPQSTLKNTIIKCTHFGLKTNKANVLIEDSEFSLKDTALAAYGDSVVLAVRTNWKDTNDIAVEAGTGTKVSLDDSMIDSIQYGGVLAIDDDSSIDLQNVSITNIPLGTAISLFDHAEAILKNVTIDTVARGVEMVRGGNFDADNLKISNASHAGLISYGGDLIMNNILKVKNSEFFNNNFGIYSLAPTIADISQNSIHGNLKGATEGDTTNIHLENNWWGDATGPKHSLNVKGKGDIVSDHIIFTPWLTSDPLIAPPPPTGNSNILFIPGFQGSRLYKSGGILNPNDQLWEPNTNNDVQNLFMDSQGVSIDQGIYGRDLVDQANILIPTAKFYKTFMDSLDTLVADKTIAAWAPVPYDWRFSPEYIVEHGVRHPDGTISYIDPIPAGSMPYLVSLIDDLAKSSLSGKVTIVTHSNGGLVVKALMRKLEELQKANGNTLITKIDKVIMVAAPEKGTPKAIAGLLHGYNTSIFGGLVLSTMTARDFGRNLPGAYSLLPAPTYFDSISVPVVEFDKSLDTVNNFRSVYGDTITTSPLFQDFLQGTLDARQIPLSADTKTPIILNSAILDEANTVHTDIDTYQFPQNINVNRIVGWGIPTMRGVRYVAKRNCLFVVRDVVCKDEIDEKPLLSSDGDKTVVSPSAVTTQGQTFYFNLDDYNQSNKTNYGHATIFETNAIIDVVKNIVTGDTTLPPTIVSQKPHGSDNLILSVHSPVALDVYDSAGSHTGALAPLSDFSRAEENIPNSEYSVFGDGKYISVDTGDIYNIKITGLDFGTWSFVAERYINDTLTNSVVFGDILTTPLMQADLKINNGVVSSLTVDIDGDRTVDITKTINSSFDPLEYLSLMKKVVLSLHLSKNIEKNLLRKIDHAIDDIQKGKIRNATDILQALLKTISLGKGHLSTINSSDAQNLAIMIDTLLDNLK